MSQTRNCSWVFWCKLSSCRRTILVAQQIAKFPISNVSIAPYRYGKFTTRPKQWEYQCINGGKTIQRNITKELPGCSVSQTPDKRPIVSGDTDSYIDKMVAHFGTVIDNWVFKWWLVMQNIFTGLLDIHTDK